jgi:dihydroorotase
MGYDTRVGSLPDMLATVRRGQMYDPQKAVEPSGRSILKDGMVVDPANGTEDVKDIAFQGQYIVEVADEIKPEPGDRVYNVAGLLVWPGLIDMHLHLGDLFEVSTEPIFGAVADGVTLGLSPGAGNTFMAPSLLGAEVDRGVPMNIGVYIGALNMMGSMLSVDELVALFKGELDEETAFAKMTRNRITYLTAPLTVGIKDHMGHWISSDEHIDGVFEVTSRAGLIFMSHTQDPSHAERLVGLSKGRPIHLAHATAAGCGTHDDPKEGMERVVELIKQPHVSGEFVTTMLRPGRGSREGLQMPKDAQQVAYDALSNGIVDVLMSDGQNEATMKGFGDTRDNVPAILELAEMGVLTLSQAVSTMTVNPAKLIAKLHHEEWWTRELGHLGVGARANITVVDRLDKLPTYTFVNGVMAGFENRLVREANGAGGWVSKFGILDRIGVGDLAAFGYVLD